MYNLVGSMAANENDRLLLAGIRSEIIKRYFRKPDRRKHNLIKGVVYMAECTAPRISTHQSNNVLCSSGSIKGREAET